MTKHTKGQWRIEEDFIVADRYIAKIETWHIVGAGTSYPEINKELQEESEANARLIASAPELLEALKGCRDLIASKEQIEELKNNDYAQRIVLSVIDKAISKAGGKIK